MKTKFAFALVLLGLLTVFLGLLTWRMGTQAGYLKSADATTGLSIGGTSHRLASRGELGSSGTTNVSSIKTMKREKFKLSPLLGPGFPNGLGEAVQPRELFSIWRTLPEFAAWDDLTLACMVGDTQRAKDLLDSGANPNGNAGLGTTPLIEALSHNQPDVALLLLAKGADASRQTPSGGTALHLAASNGWADLARRILSQEIDIDSTNENGWTPLILATMRRHADVAELLLSHGANTEIRDISGSTAILYATTGGQEESGGDFNCLSALIKYGADVNSSDSQAWTALMGAAFYGDLRSARLLVERGAEVRAQNKNGETARSLAESNGQLQVAEFLAQVGG